MRCWQVHQLELRRKEAQAEREKAVVMKHATRDMFTRSIELAKQKRDQQRHEEMVGDMKLLEETMKATADETLAIRQRKVSPFCFLSYQSNSPYNCCLCVGY